MVFYSNFCIWVSLLCEYCLHFFYIFNLNWFFLLIFANLPMLMNFYCYDIFTLFIHSHEIVLCNGYSHSKVPITTELWFSVACWMFSCGRTIGVIFFNWHGYYNFWIYTSQITIMNILMAYLITYCSICIAAIGYNLIANLVYYSVAPQHPQQKKGPDFDRSFAWSTTAGWPTTSLVCWWCVFVSYTLIN